MSCYYPLIRVSHKNTFIKTKDGNLSNKGIIIPYNSANYEDWVRRFKTCPETEDIKIQMIPCGHCIGCRLAQSRDWATRCTLESQEYEENWFITLTYDDEHLVTPEETCNFETGEIFYNPGDWKGMLVPKHLSEFIKKLRRHYEYHYQHTGIRFFACGEYGEQFKRPHYHAILFNMPIELKKLKVHHINQEHQPLYECEEIQKIWGKGLISIGHVTWSSCAYVARYVTKKMGGELGSEHYASSGQLPEFVRMSRRPGIGRTFYESHKKEIYENDEIIMKTVKGNIGSIKPPRYYDKLYDIDYPSDMEEIKSKREELARNNMLNEDNTTTMNYRERLKIKERTQVSKGRLLKRQLE